MAVISDINSSICNKNDVIMEKIPTNIVNIIDIIYINIAAITIKIAIKIRNRSIVPGFLKNSKTKAVTSVKTAMPIIRRRFSTIVTTIFVIALISKNGIATKDSIFILIIFNGIFIIASSLELLKVKCNVCYIIRSICIYGY